MMNLWISETDGPGYGKTFHNQVCNYMHRLQKQYADSLQAHTAFITFARGTQSLPMFYYKGKRSAMGHDYFLRNEELMDTIRVGLSDVESP